MCFEVELGRGFLLDNLGLNYDTYTNMYNQELISPFNTSLLVVASVCVLFSVVLFSLHAVSHYSCTFWGPFSYSVVCVKYSAFEIEYGKEKLLLVMHK